MKDPKGWVEFWHFPRVEIVTVSNEGGVPPCVQTFPEKSLTVTELAVAPPMSARRLTDQKLTMFAYLVKARSTI